MISTGFVQEKVHSSIFVLWRAMNQKTFQRKVETPNFAAQKINNKLLCSQHRSIFPTPKNNSYPLNFGKTKKQLNEYDYVKLGQDSFCKVRPE
jgi:hypothetical protein